MAASTADFAYINEGCVAFPVPVARLQLGMCGVTSIRENQQVPVR